jgi:hypothetical protein
VSRVFTLLGLAFGLAAAVLLAVTVTLVVRDQRFRAESVTAEGTVTEVVAVGTRCDDEDEAGSASDPRRCQTVFAPRVRFSTADGVSRVFLSGTASWPPAHAVGDTVMVRYRPSEPGSARLDEGGAGVGVVVLGVLTVAFGGFALLWAVLGRRARSWTTGLDASTPVVDPSGAPSEYRPPPWQQGRERRRRHLR